VKISVVDKDYSTDRELNLEFSDEFRALTVPEQQAAFGEYLDKLRRDAARFGADSADRQGMLAVLQIAEQLSPHIASGEIDLDETIVVELKAGIMLSAGLSPSKLN
jgi:hypothetical protein